MKIPNFIHALMIAATLVNLQAQTVVSTGAIRGTVRDSTGAVVPAAAIVLHGHGIQPEERSANEVGIFVFPAEPVGSYRLEVSAKGLRTAVLEGVVVQVGQPTALNVELQPGPGSDAITVVGESPLLRVEDSDQSSIIDRELLADLPLSGRRFLDFALLVPNGTPDGQQGLVSFAGEQGGEDTGYANGNGANSFTVDGASATSNYFGAARGGERVPYIFGENAIEEFQVAVSPYRSDYGGAAAGFVNVVTRSGSDSMHGNAFYYNRNSGTGANDAVDKAAGIRRPVDVLQQFGSSAGGPMVREHAWFFSDYEQHRERNPISVINPALSGLDQIDFGVPGGVALPAPTGQFPVPGALTSPDARNPQYLQNVANAIYGIDSNLGVRQRYRNDWSLFSKIDYHDAKDDRFYLSVNWNRFDSPSGMIVNSQTPLYGKSALANSYVRDYHVSAGWSHAYGSNLLNEVHASFSRDDQFSTPTGLVNPALPSVVLSPGGEGEGGTRLELGNAGFAGGRTNEALWQASDQVSYLRGKHTFKFGIEFSRSHVTDLAFGGFDPDAQAQNGTFRGSYSFSSLTNYALGIYDSFFQSTGQPKFRFNVPYAGFFLQDAYRVSRHLSLDVGVREDFQVYPQPMNNPAFPLTGQFPNEYRRISPRFGFAWQPWERTVVRGGFGKFYENFNGLNYRNSVVSNGLLSQQASVSRAFDPALPPNQQVAMFPNQISDPSLFSASDISLVDLHFRFPYILHASLQVEHEVVRDTVITVGADWSHGVHLISSSAYDLNLNPPVGTTTYVLCPSGATGATQCAGGRSVVLPNLDGGLLTDGRVSSAFGQINETISPGVNNYRSLYAQAQRRFQHGLAFQGAYTLSKNIMSRAVDFNNQFDFGNTRAPYLLDQRQRLSVALIYEPDFGRHFKTNLPRRTLHGWTVSSVMQFASGRPYAALINAACTTADTGFGDCLGTNATNGPAGNSLNNTAANQSTANSALGINAGSPSPFTGLDSFYGPWTQQVDLGLARRFRIAERQNITFQVQAFNLLNHANYYVQNGNGVNPIQYEPYGTTCGDGQTIHQTCYLVPNTGQFGRLTIVNALNGSRVLQFAFKYSF
jgi:hypothetical protein